MPAQKKDPSVRRRRNKATTRATLKPKIVVALEDYSKHTVAALRDEIDRRNESRPEHDHLARTGTKTVLIARLTADDDPTPQLPDRPAGWHPVTRKFWAEFWASPMSNQCQPSDIYSLYACAMAYDDMWTGETATARSKAMAEFRQQGAPFGITPKSRLSLEWSFEETDEAKARGEQRRNAGQPPAPPQEGNPPAVDPRGIHAAT
jgi:hypothetical protein